MFRNDDLVQYEKNVELYGFNRIQYLVYQTSLDAFIF